jgi:glycosyltransferase involved in cell wall biosynthesis
MIRGSRVVLNVDGLEWERSKWGRAGRSYYRVCAWLAPKLPVVLVSDATVIAAYYKDRYGRRTVYIPYGTDSRRLPPGDELRRLGLRPGRYMLYVSRLEPENHAEVVIEAYERAGGAEVLGVPLVLVGDAPYAGGYKEELRRAAERVGSVMMPGYVFGDGYVELQSNAMLYVQATEVGGTHPALVEAMGRGCCIVANDVPEHREVLGEAGRYYARNDAESLAAALRSLVSDKTERTRLGERAGKRAAVRYSWEAVTLRYEMLFRRVVNDRPSRPAG